MKMQGRILIVEDLPDWLREMRNILEREGDYSIHAATTYDEAVDLLQSQSFELVVIDVRLVDWDEKNVQGLDLFNYINKHKGTNAIIVTGYPTPEIVRRAFKVHEVSDFLFKQAFTATEFRDAVRKAVKDALARKGRRALVVEDEADWQRRLSSLLEQEGYVVEVVKSYSGALGELRRESFDLAIIDLLLSPEPKAIFDGMTLLEDVFEVGTPVIIVTGFGTPELAREAFREYGVFAFLDKGDFDSTGFRELVREAVAPREELTPEQKAKYRETIRKIFRGEIITFGRG